jgi:hypothetical protein
VAAGLLSGLAAVLTAVLVLTGADTALSRPLLPAGAVAVAAILTGAVGALAAATGFAEVRRPFVTGVLAVVGVVQAISFGLVLQSVQTLAFAGYLVAFALPAGLAVIGVGVVRRYPRLRWPLLGVALLAVIVGVSTGILRGDLLIRLLSELAHGVARVGLGLLVTAVFVAVAVAWVAVVASIVGATAGGRALTATVTRHRRTLTVLAALGPLPYGLVRMTWLTPWPLFAPASTDLVPEMRLWGLLLGGAALLGAALTIGLIRPWGERFPRWMPGVAGRPVPIAAAAVPGSLVAVIVTSAAVPMLMLLTISPAASGPGGLGLLDRLLAIVIFPCWIWGPLLGLAVWGYVGHRLGYDRPDSALR